MNEPLIIDLPNDRTETFLRSIRENLTPQVQMVVVIFPTSRDDRYSAVKKLCCVESPVPSQVKPLINVATSVFLWVLPRRGSKSVCNTYGRKACVQEPHALRIPLFFCSLNMLLVKSS